MTSVALHYLEFAVFADEQESWEGSLYLYRYYLNHA